MHKTLTTTNVASWSYLMHEVKPFFEPCTVLKCVTWWICPHQDGNSSNKVSTVRMSDPWRLRRWTFKYRPLILKYQAYQKRNTFFEQWFNFEKSKFFVAKIRPLWRVSCVLRKRKTECIWNAYEIHETPRRLARGARTSKDNGLLRDDLY